MNTYETRFRLVLSRLTNSVLTAPGQRRKTSARSTKRSSRPALESLEDRKLMTLTPIAYNAGFPYTSIVELQATFPDHKVYVGSGAMVDSFHVLTAGHVMYSYADGGFATSIIATPELNGSYKPFGTASMTYERTFTTWTAYSKAHPGQTAAGSMDIALLTLNRNIGTSTGWMSFGYDNNNSDFRAGTIMNTAGYPASGGYSGNYMEFSTGGLYGLTSDGSELEFYQSSITIYGGQSGSPIWKYTSSNNARVIEGVVTGGSGASSSLNVGTRITQSIFNTLRGWESSDASPSFNAITGPNVVTASVTPVARATTGVTSVTLTESQLKAPSQVTPSGTTKTPLLTYFNANAPLGTIWFKSRPVNQMRTRPDVCSIGLVL
jgi:V8-like Glu-specific endopeptidase